MTAYPSVGRAVRAARFLVERTLILKQFGAGRLDSDLSLTCKEKDSEKLTDWLKTLGSGGKPDEYDAKALVRMYGIQVPEFRRVLSGQPFSMDGIEPPYVLKVCSSEILHKTELQGVMLNVDQSCVSDCFNQIRNRFPDTGILIENQMSFTGPEFIIGIIDDPAMGHAVMVGAGGTFTEIYKDTAFRLAPCTVEDALDMIDELVLAPVFDNFRGMDLDKEGLARTISRVSELARDMGARLNQLDINPIVFSGREWVALDVKALLNPG